MDTIRIQVNRASGGCESHNKESLMKTCLGLLLVLVTLGLNASAFAEKPIHVYLTAFGNPGDGNAKLATMNVTGLCYQVLNSSLWTSQLESSDIVSQDGGTVFFNVTVYEGNDQIEFQVLPGSELTCRGTVTHSNGKKEPFRFHYNKIQLGSIRETNVYSGPSYVSTMLGILGQTN